MCGEDRRGHSGSWLQREAAERAVVLLSSLFLFDSFTLVAQSWIHSLVPCCC